jgi:hypothetical protein
MNADDTFGAKQSAPPFRATPSARPLRWRTSSLSAFVRDMQTQVESNTRAMRQFSTQLLHELARRTKPSLSSQSWQAAAQAVARAQAQPIAARPQLMSQLMQHTPTPTKTVPAVRAIQWVEPASGQAQPLLHLRLSGRFSDVCAELERLAAQEGRS